MKTTAPEKPIGMLCPLRVISTRWFAGITSTVLKQSAPWTVTSCVRQASAVSPRKRTMAMGSTPPTWATCGRKSAENFWETKIRVGLWNRLSSNGLRMEKESRSDFNNSTPVTAKNLMSFNAHFSMDTIRWKCMLSNAWLHKWNPFCPISRSTGAKFTRDRGPRWKRHLHLKGF